MRTRNANKPKPAPVVKSAPATRKSAAKTPQKPPEIPAESSATPKSSGTKRTRAIQAKNKEIQDVPTVGKFLILIAIFFELIVIVWCKMFN